MSYTGSREQQRQLRAAILNDLNGPVGSRRAGAAIVRSLATHLRNNGQARVADGLLANITNLDRYIRNYARDIGWGDEATKSLLWDFYGAEGALRPTSANTTHNPHAHAIEFVFQKSSLQPQPIAPLVGQFVIYKRTISNPQHLVVRGFLKLTENVNSPKSLLVEEIHINRSHRIRPQDFMKEIWSGSVIPRERSYCMITYENTKGTPKIAVFEKGSSTPEGLVFSMNGHSVECIENWGPGNVFRSGIYIERLPEEFDCDTDPQIDLVPMSVLRKTNSHVIRYL